MSAIIKDNVRCVLVSTTGKYKGDRCHCVRKMGYTICGFHVMHMKNAGLSVDGFRTNHSVKTMAKYTTFDRVPIIPILPIMPSLPKPVPVKKKTVKKPMLERKCSVKSDISVGVGSVKGKGRKVVNVRPNEVCYLDCDEWTEI